MPRRQKRRVKRDARTSNLIVPVGMTAIQVTAMGMLFEGYNVSEICKQLKISKAQFDAWNREQPWQRELQDRREYAITRTLDRTIGLGERAITFLAEVMDDPTADVSDRLTAAKEICRSFDRTINAAANIRRTDPGQIPFDHLTFDQMLVVVEQARYEDEAVNSKDAIDVEAEEDTNDDD